MSGILYIVSTPIGNLEDITLRALRILKEVDLIAAEDTRRTKGLLTHYGISKPLTSYFSHNEKEKGEYLLNKLKDGKNIAIVSDAGTPGISDPAYYLIRLAMNNDIKVHPVPGPTGVIAALSTAGLPTDRFIFEGFLPRKAGKRHKRLESFINEERTVIIYESPYRIITTLQEIKDILGNRFVAIVRELTKIHEEVIRGTLDEVIQKLKGRAIKGEIILVISCAEF
ncbi:MAG: 16S rRNA (cytidine(1402)-2'-O)-methyltransferase [Nitrospinae bacterium RIFCSPLOWO2_02_FULL_39_110]|nr:MAG: 16S rRNA (cytidine(1402)-2'-O)-methyltransferase [Nitrospinae bacterium RIFCSPHIGHO2_12_FULL_39_42]OGV99866.1 MAG: 16S rRNA (cytidine(1402)-2'-O)-methyltransferase [Nitrospinae bacterium RIFCSPHIGHO2_02_FULL_39_82]OGW02898.1 MAG: 16S rRNA (cytidine(1402)-2'-O)-methyltransferase [Nitrospinae bacterium RIFCSPLOWO2_02_39_17]OGW05869.1 MAG: 16S rRNA (cytidine(1402)-2'-O)-methyltransferase [Nitrospinae bacterium RIFCSPLOWO2_02_FULL_39_110]OGW11373.1 MAG: 16S rRNA (cytidine(1402)-2'-O)-methyl